MFLVLQTKSHFEYAIIENSYIHFLDTATSDVLAFLLKINSVANWLHVPSLCFC